MFTHCYMRRSKRRKLRSGSFVRQSSLKYLKLIKKEKEWGNVRIPVQKLFKNSKHTKTETHGSILKFWNLNVIRIDFRSVCRKRSTVENWTNIRTKANIRTETEYKLWIIGENWRSIVKKILKIQNKLTQLCIKTHRSFSKFWNLDVISRDF